MIKKISVILTQFGFRSIKLGKIRSEGNFSNISEFESGVPIMPSRDTKSLLPLINCYLMGCRPMAGFDSGKRW